jgi:hypothetical protein
MIYEIPLLYHDSASRRFAGLINDAQILISNENDRLYATGSGGKLLIHKILTLHQAYGKKNNTRQADESFVPNGKPQPQSKKNWGTDKVILDFFRSFILIYFQGDPYPNLIVEVGYAEGLKELGASRAVWFGENTTVRILILIKLWKVDEHHRMRMKVIVSTSE